MTPQRHTPARLAVRLTLYFVVLFGSTILVVTVWPDALQSLPVGGHDALDSFDVPELTSKSLRPAPEDESGFEITSTLRATTGSVKSAALFLSLHLSGTIAARTSRIRELNANYDTSRAHFEAFLESIESEVRENRQRVSETHHALLAALTAEERSDIEKLRTKAINAAIKTIQSI
jgi:hypothetical protein